MLAPLRADVADRRVGRLGRSCGRGLLLAFALVIVDVSAQAPPSLPASKPPIVLLGDRDYPPLSYLEDGVPKGLDVDVAMAVGRVLGRDVRVELGDWGAAQDRVLAGDADGLTDLAISDARRSLYDFMPTTTITHEFGVFVRAGTTGIGAANDLAGKSVGVTSGGLPRQFFAERTGVRLVVVENYSDGFDRLSAGAVDALAVDLWVGAYTIQQRHLTGITMAGVPFASLPATIAVKKGNADLAREIAGALETLKAGGTLAQIEAKWRPEEMVFLSRQRVQRYVELAAALFLLLLLGGLTVWVTTLKRQIRTRKAAEAALLETNQRLGLALSSARMGTWRWTASTGQAIRDASLNRIFGLTAEESAGPLEDGLAFVHPDDRAAVAASFERANLGSGRFSTEFRIVRPDGAVRWIQGVGESFRDASGALTGLTGVSIDITDRRNVEEHVRLLAHALQSTHDCVSVTDTDGRVLYVNHAFLTTYEYEEHELVGRPIAIVRAEPATREMPTAAAMDLDHGWRGELLNRSRSGRVFPISLSTSLVLDDQDRIIACVGVARDITEQRRASEINKLLVSQLEPEALHAVIAESLGRVVALDYAGLALFDPATNELTLRAHSFYDGRTAGDGLRLTACTLALASAALGHGEARVFRALDLDALGAAGAAPGAEGLMTMCGVPLGNRRGGGSLGALVVGSRNPDAYSADDVAALERLSNFAAVAIENAETYEEVQQLKNRLTEEKLYLQEEIRVDHNFADIVGSSAAIKEVLQQIEIVAPTESTVLLLGETGTGKELLARALHDLSSRRDRTFVRVNAAALPAGLLESELFGHERGAFTGAATSRVGRFELAHHGTLFLDEVGDIPLEVQAKLLRVLQEREFERLGSTRTQKVDVRIIAATNRDLSRMVADGTFRSDLYYRLSVFPVEVPALRDRAGDVPALVQYFVKKFSVPLRRQITTIPASTMAALQAWPWPGNIRELQNLIERAVILSPGPVLQVPIPEIAPAIPPGPAPAPASAPAASTLRPAPDDAGPEPASGMLDTTEREHILRVLRDADGVIAGPDGAAARLGLKRTTLQSKMRKLGIKRPSF